MSDRPALDGHITALIAAHGALAAAVADASRLMSVHGRHEFAEHLDRHRAELNVAVGDMAMWLASFGRTVDVTAGLRPAVDSRPGERVADSFEVALLDVRRELQNRRSRVLTALRQARPALHLAGLPADELTAYRRVIRHYAGEAIDVVAAVHRLTLANRYITHLATLRGDRRSGAALLRQWMDELDAADRDGELALAASCGYGHLVAWYRAESD